MVTFPGFASVCAQVIVSATPSVVVVALDGAVIVATGFTVSKIMLRVAVTVL